MYIFKNSTKSCKKLQKAGDWVLGCSRCGLGLGAQLDSGGARFARFDLDRQWMAVEFTNGRYRGFVDVPGGRQILQFLYKILELASKLQKI